MAEHDPNAARILHTAAVDPLGRDGAPRRFLTTRWSVVQAAGGTANSPAVRRALDELIRSYWFPLYAYLRRDGYGEAEASDLTQAYFVRVLEKREFLRADPHRGTFRTYLLRGLKFFLSAERERAGALKRGGGVTVLELDTAAAESRLGELAGSESAPDRAFERAWALEVLARAQERLAAEYEARGRASLYRALAPALDPGAAPPHADLAEATGLGEGAVKTALHRLRKRFGACLLAEVGETLAEGEDARAELRDLFEALGPG